MVYTYFGQIENFDMKFVLSPSLYLIGHL